jgi:hypothetical protein
VTGAAIIVTPGFPGVLLSLIASVIILPLDGINEIESLGFDIFVLHIFGYE